MVISETGEDTAACGSHRAEVREDADRIGKIDKKSRPEKSIAAGSGEAGLHADILRNNNHAKKQMADELLRMGFSIEAASRILNVNLDDYENL